MYGQDFGRLVGDDSPEAERNFHEKLVRLEAEGASNQETAETVMRDPFVLALVWIVTGMRRLKAGHGARTPDGWNDLLAREPGLRDEWRCETVRVLGERLRTKKSRQEDDDPNAECDLTRESIGGYWRVKITYAAIRAALNLQKESRLKFRRSREPIYCYSDGMSEVTDKKTKEDSTDTALDLIGAINELQNPRQRAVMQLSLRGCNYQEIAERLTTGESGPTGGRVTYEMVRGAFEKAREILKKRLKLSPSA
jgi:hypothetical protein